MNINNFLKMPLVKIIVTILFIIYIYNQTKNDPRTASYHFKNADLGKSIDNIKGALKVAKNSVNNAPDILESQQEIESKKIGGFYSGQISFNDLVVGDKNPQVVCGSEVTIQYSLLEKDTDNLINQSQMVFKIGEGFNRLIEKAIIGMKIGGIRIIDIPADFSTGDYNYDNLIKNKKMIYKVLLMNNNNSSVQGANCE